MKFKDYQEKVLQIIDNLKSQKLLNTMAQNCGKIATFTNIKRKGQMLVLAYRVELVTQPIKYYNCLVGIEMANHKFYEEKVVIASIMSLTHRLEKSKSDEFNMIIINEAHRYIK